MTVTAQLHDGRTLEFPDGTAPEVVQATVKRVLGSASAAKPAFEAEAEKTLSYTPAELIAGSAPVRFALGAASPILGLAQLGAEAAGDKTGSDTLRQVEELKRRGMEAYGQQGADVAGTAGAVMSPASLATMKLPIPASFMGKVGQGAAIGAGFGASTPVTEGDSFTGSKATQAVTGALLGALVPAGIEGVKKGYSVVRNVIDPWLPGGIDRAVGRTANEAAGSKRDAVIAALEQNRQIVPGSRPTAGEAAAPAGSAEFSGLQRVVEGKRPTSYFDRAAEQEAARRGAVTSIGQDKPALEAAILARKTASDPLYTAARGAGDVVDVAPVIAQIDDVLAKNPGNRALVSELSAIRDGLHQGQTVSHMGKRSGGTPRTNAQEVASVLDDLKAALAKEDNKFIKGNLNDLKNAIADVIPGYQAAQRTFSEASVPVNRMQVGQELEKALTSPLGTTERAGAFATAVREAPRMIKKATGAPRFDSLDEVLAPDQSQAVQNVLQDLQRSSQHEQLARSGTERARELVGQVTPSIPSAGMFNPKYSVIRAIGNRIEGRVAGKSVERLSQAMEDPALMAQIMRSATPSERAAIVDALLAQKVGRAAVIGGTMGAAGQEQF